MAQHTLLAALFTIILFTCSLFAESSVEEITKDGVIAYYHENYPDANKLLSQAAQNGNAEAHYYLGAMCFNGQGLTQNYQEAVNHFTIAAAKNHPGAQLILGVLYIQGVGVPQNFNRAARLLLLSAKQNNANAQEILGWAYHNGVGVRQNNMIAYALWNYVAANGSQWAQMNRNYALNLLNDREVYEAQELSLHIQKLWSLLDKQNNQILDQTLISHRKKR